MITFLIMGRDMNLSFDGHFNGCVLGVYIGVKMSLFED